MRADRPSSTAALIAAATVFLSRSPATRDLVPAGAVPWCERCLEALSPARLRLVHLVSHPVLRWLPLCAERSTVPGLMLHFMARKRWIEDAVRKAFPGDAGQLVVIGAGFDTLAVRLAGEFPRATLIEIDHPATQRVKGLVLAGIAVRLVAADLSRRPLAEVLAELDGYDPGRSAVFVVEGLLMYLTDEEIATLFGAIRGIHRGQLTIVFTVMEPMADGRLAFHNATALTRWLLGRWSEPFRSALPKAGAAAFLQRFGLELEAVREPEPGHAQGENVMVASGRAA